MSFMKVNDVLGQTLGSRIISLKIKVFLYHTRHDLCIGNTSSAFRPLYVTVVVQRHFKVQVHDEFVMKGNVAVLQCHVPSFVREYVSVAYWKREDGVVIRSTVSKGGRYSVLPNGELHIRDVTSKDGLAGYRCHVRHRLTSDITFSTDVGRLVVKVRFEEGLDCKHKLVISSLSSHGHNAFLLNRRSEDIENESQNDEAKQHCVKEQTQLISIGMFLMVVLASCWVSVAHLLNSTYINNVYVRVLVPNSSSPAGNEKDSSAIAHTSTMTSSSYDAPLFTTWFCAIWNAFFFPIYMGARLCSQCVEGFREKGFTVVQFLGRCGLFCLLWVISNYMFIHSLRILDTTVVVALYSSTVSFVYLLSWVVLHEQFIGIRIVAVILCNTGISLLAYMDGTSRTITLGGVILASASAVGSAVYKVFFKKFIGEVTFGQLSLFFTLIGLLDAFLIWPLFVGLYFTHVETIFWNQLPWPLLGGAASLSLVANLLTNFGVLWTYDVFLTLGLILAVPVSAVIDIRVYGVVFRGMKLVGVILIDIGFLLVLSPSNWPEYLNKILLARKRTYRKEPEKQLEVEQSKGQRSRLRTLSGHVK
ncbi:solute carrier family 35 member F3-like [Tachypleus tridentatus]|uniref:solute carrier family 35 member F3-like n=1 Tax=Tachypleus tridentatus TaxID=6853 RepID=UPI003FD22E10